MDYTVDIAIETRRAVTQGALEAVAAIGGAAEGRPGGRRIETTLTVSAPDAAAAARNASATLTELVPGDVVVLEVMTTAEQDWRLGLG